LFDHTASAQQDGVLQQLAEGDARDGVRRAYDLGVQAGAAAARIELQRISHDLRTPLNSILGFGQLLQLDDLQPEQRDAVEQIIRSGNQLLERVNALIDVVPVPADAGVTIETAAASSSGARETKRTFTVVYIEDNLANVRLIEKVFKLRSNVQLVPALLGELGIQRTIEHQPDLVLLDLHLPDMDGVDVLRALKRDQRTAAIPIAIITADATPGQIQPLAGEGARFHVTKPIDIEVLLSIVDDVEAEIDHDHDHDHDNDNDNESGPQS